jgi:hypothetical protein
MNDEDLLDMIMPASARSKAQFRFLQGQRKTGDKMTPDQAEEMVAPPEDPWSGQPQRKYYQFLPETAKDGPDPFEEYNKSLRDIQMLRRQRSDARDFIPPEPNTGPMTAGAVHDITPQEYDDEEAEPPYPGVTPQPDRPMTKRDRYVEDADRVRDNRHADPYEDRGIFNFKLDDIRDALRWGKGDEVGDDALYSLNESENPFKGQADAIYNRIKGLNPEMDDFELIRQMRQRLGMKKPDKLYDMIDEDRAFRENNPDRGGMFRLDKPTRDPFSDTYPQRGGRQRSASFDERFSGE